MSLLIGGVTATKADGAVGCCSNAFGTVKQRSSVWRSTDPGVCCVLFEVGLLDAVVGGGDLFGALFTEW